MNGQVFQDANGTWRAEIKDETGKVIQERMFLGAMAEQRAHNFVRDIVFGGEQK